MSTSAKMALRATCVPQVAPRHGLGCGATAGVSGTSSSTIKVLRGSRCLHTSHVSNTRRSARINSQTTRAAKRHCSPFGRGSIRMKSYWHRPGCTWASSKGDINAAKRDADCPACQSAEDEPYEYTMREMLWQQKRNLVDMRRMLEKHPYETFFGMSNARLRGQDPMQFISEARRRMLDDLRQSCASRRSLINSSTCDHSHSRDGTSDPHPTMKGPSASAPSKPTSMESAASESTLSSEKPRPSPHIHASITWSSSNTDTNGVRHVSTGRLIYDPISGRMVPSDGTPSDSTSSLSGAGVETSKASAHINPSEDSAKHGQRQAAAIESDKGGKGFDDSETTHVTKSSSSRLVTSLDRHSRAEAETAPQPAAQSEKTVTRQRKWDSMIQAWKKEQELGDLNPQSEPTKSADSQTSTDQSSLRSRRNRAEAWIQYNNARHNEAPNTKKSRIESGRTSSAPNETTGKPNVSVSRDSPPNLKGTHSWQNIVRRDVSSLGAISVLRKDKPLKSMTHMELSRHRAALLKAWTPRAEASVPDAAERRLREEIAKHRNAMTDFEYTRKHTGSGKSSMNQSRSGHGGSTSLTGEHSQSDARQNGSEMLAGEGDMSPNVVDFARMDRWYKKKAPHATQPEESQSRDRELVSNIRNIYENAYGTIDSAHRHPAFSHGTASVNIGPHNRSINPVDGTGPATPSPVPQTGNFASPTGFVNHDVFKPSPRSPTTKDDRIIRKVEPSFSGAIPVQKYNTKEIQEIWNKQGFSAPEPQAERHHPTSAEFDGSEPSRGAGSGIPHHQHRRGQSDKKRRRRSRVFLRGVVRILAISSWTAICCYATGYIIEETRAGSSSSHSSFDSYSHSTPPTRDLSHHTELSSSSSSLNFLRRRRQQRRARQAAAAAAAEEEEAERQAAAAREVSRGTTWADMPLHGLELPLMGALSACVWYLIWGGQ